MNHLHAEQNFTGLFEALFRHSLDGILLTRPDGPILRANPAACAALGRSEDEIRALGRERLVVPTPELERALRERAVRGATKAELLFRRPDGSVFPVEASSTVIRLSVGPPVTLLTFRDVTQRRDREEQLRKSLEVLRETEERFRVAFQTLPDAITLTERDSGRILEVNDGATQVTGYSKEEMIGRTTLELGIWADGDREEVVEQLRATGHVRDFDTRFRRKDGQIVEVVFSAQHASLGGRQVLLAVTRDVTAERAAERARATLEQQLRQSHKMEAIGRLAGGVAHDFNNILTVIFSCAEALEDDLRRGVAASREDVKEIRVAAERARDLTRQLLAFARKQVIDPVALDLDEVVRGCEKLLRRVIGEDVRLEVAPRAGLWPVRCDRAQVEQVILHLAVNARDALPSGGTLRIETQNVTVGAGDGRFADAAPGAYVCVRVVDDGVGMVPEVRDRIFEPFFTTKPQGQGTGLGLAVVHGIVAQSGGHIRVESAPGRGTRIEILFPVTVGDRASADEPTVSPTVISGDETILIVEDEPTVRDATARSLRKAGYRVLTAANGREALHVAANEPRLDLLVCDVMMPEQNGREVHDAVRALRPDVRALFVSGYPDEVIQERGRLAPGIEFLAKPFTAGSLLARVRQVIGRR